MTSFSPDPEAGTQAGFCNFLGEILTLRECCQPSSTIRLVSLSSLKAQPLSAGFPRCPDGLGLCVNLESIDRSTAFVVFVSHCWMRGYDGAEGWDGRPHPDNAQHEKFKLPSRAWKKRGETWPRA